MVTIGDKSERIRQVGTPLRSPGQAAADAIDFALSHCRKLGAKQDPRELLRIDFPEAQGYFRYGLAVALAEYLAEADPTVTAAYIADCEDPQEELGSEPPRATAPLLLIIRAERKTAALESLLLELSAELTAHYRALLGAKTGMVSGLLSAYVVDDREASDGVGFGAVLCGFRQRPTVVWAR